MLTSPPLAPKTLSCLNKLGITTQKDLQRTGSIKAFLLLKAAGLTVTNSTLWQLEALLHGTLPQNLSESEKNTLLTRIKNHPPVAIFPPEEVMAQFMETALKQAEKSARLGEIPVGAVIVCDNRIIASAHNLCISNHNISHHAEILALAEAGQKLGNYRLDNCDLYVTLEPCPMCASAITQARIRRVVFGAAEAKTGAAGSVLNLFAQKTLNPHTAVLGGILADESQKLLQAFFQNKRKQAGGS